MVRCRLIIAFNRIECRLFRRILLHRTFSDQFIRLLIILHLGAQLLLQHILLDLTGIILEAGLLRETKQMRLQFRIVSELAFARLRDQILVDVAQRRAVLVVDADFVLLLVGQRLIIIIIIN